MPKKKFNVDSDGDAATAQVGVSGKGEPVVILGQTALSATLTKAVVFGASNLKAIYMRKKTATGYDYEAVDFAAVGAASAAGWILVSVGGGKLARSFDITPGATGLSRTLYCKVHAAVTVKFSQPNKVYTKVPQAARTLFGQTDAPTAAKEVVQGANYFAFPTTYRGIPAGTAISREVLKAKVRYAEASTTGGGVYSSYCQEDVTAPVIP